MTRAKLKLVGISSFILICLCCLMCHVPEIESDLSSRSRMALSGAGIAVDSISMTGQIAGLHGTVADADLKARAARIVEGVYGVRRVDNRLTVASPQAPPTPPQPPAAPKADAGAEATATPQANLDELMRVKQIQFETSKDIIKPESYPIVNEIAAILKRYPSLRIRIGGHTDNTGNEDYNIWLSEQRARAVAAYLRGKGIAADRLTAKGYGSSQPLTTNETSKGREKNRRVQFYVLEDSK